MMIDTSVLELFRKATLTEAGHLVLPEMSRDLYGKCQKVLDKMGFRWDGRKSVRATSCKAISILPLRWPR